MTAFDINKINYREGSALSKGSMLTICGGEELKSI